MRSSPGLVSLEQGVATPVLLPQQRGQTGPGVPSAHTQLAAAVAVMPAAGRDPGAALFLLLFKVTLDSSVLAVGKWSWGGCEGSCGRSPLSSIPFPLLCGSHWRSLTLPVAGPGAGVSLRGVSLGSPRQKPLSRGEKGLDLCGTSRFLFFCLQLVAAWDK